LIESKRYGLSRILVFGFGEGIVKWGGLV